VPLWVVECGLGVWRVCVCVWCGICGRGWQGVCVGGGELWPSSVAGLFPRSLTRARALSPPSARVSVEHAGSTKKALYLCLYGKLLFTQDIIIYKSAMKALYHCLHLRIPRMATICK
jgi:hypothetical protein